MQNNKMKFINTFKVHTIIINYSIKNKSINGYLYIINIINTI